MCSAAFEPLPGTQGTCPALFSFRNLLHCNLERFLACCNNVDAVSKAERTVFAAVNKLAVGGVNVNRGIVAVNGDNVTVYAHAFCVIGGIVYGIYACFFNVLEFVLALVCAESLCHSCGNV